LCLATGPAPKWHFIPGLWSGSPEIRKVRLLQLWGCITLHEDLWLRWGLKQSCSPCQELSKGMLHATYTQGNLGDSWLLMVSLSFAHNLCLQCLNGSCEPNLNSCVPRTFQWYKEFFNPIVTLQSLSEDLGIDWDSNSQDGNSLVSLSVHSLTLSYTPKNIRCDSWASFLAHALALVASPILGLRQWRNEPSTLRSEPSLWELESCWTPEYLENDWRGSKPIGLKISLYHWKSLKT
jgi:hypothetical protein